ncbi:hypothetical protein BJX96DRAFT_106330 [Aspergillus floccosus]
MSDCRSLSHGSCSCLGLRVYCTVFLHHQGWQIGLLLSAFLCACFALQRVELTYCFFRCIVGASASANTQPRTATGHGLAERWWISSMDLKIDLSDFLQFPGPPNQARTTVSVIGCHGGSVRSHGAEDRDGHAYHRQGTISCQATIDLDPSLASYRR